MADDEDAIVERVARHRLLASFRSTTRANLERLNSSVLKLNADVSRLQSSADLEAALRQKITVERNTASIQKLEDMVRQLDREVGKLQRSSPEIESADKSEHSKSTATFVLRNVAFDWRTIVFVLTVVYLLLGGDMSKLAALLPTIAK